MMFSARRLLQGTVAAVVATLIPLGIPQPTHAQGELCFQQTGQCISGRFRTYWEQNGGLAIFGYPVTPASQQRNADTGEMYLTQWFERNRFEYHPENAAPYDVLLGRLGADRLGQLGRNWQNEDGATGPKNGCLWFAQTGHNVCDQAPGTRGAQAGFMSYWLTEGLADSRLDAYGRSLALHGLPLTEARMGTNASGDTVLTQWFERGRMEWHPNNPASFRVLLGLLGTEVSGNTTPQPRTLRYFWPNQIPSGYVVVKDQSFANDTSYTLQLAKYSSHGGLLTIKGGAGSEAPRNRAGAEAITVRGQQGVAYRDGGGYSIYWVEDGRPYAIIGPLWLDNTLALANALDTLSLNSWKQRLNEASQANTLTTYTHPDGLWSVTYPSNLLKPEDIGNGVIAFVSADRATIAAVDSYHADGNAYGNTGEDLRNRARDTLARLYGREVNQSDVLDATGRWETGIAFQTDRGSEGEAFYEQRNRGKGDFRVNGFLFGYKAYAEAQMRPTLIAMRDSLTIND
jgi:hypothetical protein